VKGSEFKGPPPKVKKKRFDHTEKARKRRQKRKQLTKADIKRQFRKNFRDAVDHIRTANRVVSAEAREFHLRKALERIELCISTRPGNHVLKAQRAICRTELWELEKQEKKTGSGPIEIVLDEELFE
jgi:hypothetical protein